MKEYKRKNRSVSQKVRDKISRTLTGRKKSADHARHIAEGMRRYWQSVPEEGNNEVTDQ